MTTTARRATSLPPDQVHESGRRRLVDSAHVESVEANSGAAFARKLGLKIDPNNAPRLRLFAWNTGERLVGLPPGTVLPITSLLSRETMVELAETYFEKVALVYGFIDRPELFRRLDERWARGSVPDPYDQVLCGVAALGLHFSVTVPPAVEPDLVETARDLLDKAVLDPCVSMDTVTGWVLRVAYLRMSSSPHMTWMASCTLMHVADAARIHQEGPWETVLDEGSREAVSVDTRRRLWAMAQHLNIWTSFDLGRSKTTLSGVSTRAITPRDGDYTSQLLALMPLTEALDPNQTRSADDLDADLGRLLDDCQGFEVPAVVMAYINLVLCLFRRLRAQHPGAIHSHVDSILALSRRALAAARVMVDQHLPWHHAANIPFQIVCLLLAVDTRASMAMVGEALAVLKLVRDSWNSETLREAYDTAYLLTLFHQRRKEEDARDLRIVLDMHTSPRGVAGAGGAFQQQQLLLQQQQQQLQLQQQQQQQQQQQLQQPQDQQQPPVMGAAETVWLDDLFASMPGLREFDLEQFLTQEEAYPQDIPYPTTTL
ncbi:C6 transcription factor [Geosmithia morbida]|uniref:C6 transcription factor n=1 Tax=Geosmithia morbida TaxID=1094350 RepID=A0A9P4YPS6_9HYPO|nr:C6 transcription factor [Geosmithia morbida]KAF4119559.1 C6 transcription factor [Geosmithia morbida]